MPVPFHSVLLAIALFARNQVPSHDPESVICADQLRSIGRAIDQHKMIEGRLPDSLLALVPRYLSKVSDLRCPADRSPDGDPGFGGHADPAGGVSYSYEASNAPSGGMAEPPGPTPGSDLPGVPWGTERNVRLWIRSFYGDRPPIVRCLHHMSDEGPIALNLTLEGAIYRGGPAWENDPETAAEFARRAASALSSDYVKFEKNWKLSGISAIANGWRDAARSEVASLPIADLARALTRNANSIKDPADADRIAARLFLSLRDYPAAQTEAERLLRRPGHAEEEDARQVVAESLAGRGLYREAVAVYQSMLLRNPESKNIRANLADALDAAGQTAESRAVIESIEPGRRLIRHKAPEFRAPLLGATDTSIAQSLARKKALLVNFWFVRCGPCRAEFPKLQKLYGDLKAKGLEVVSINSDDEEAVISRYVKTSGWTFPIALGRKERGANIPALYFVELFPTNFLVDATGNVVYRRVGWDDDEIRAALKKLGVE